MAERNAARDQLLRGLAQMDIDADSADVDRLIDYLALIRKWNQVDNLTAIDTLSDMVALHLLDSLTALPLVAGRLLDVGSGAGLPGIPLAILRPELEVTLLDASAKRVRFQRQAVIELKLANVDMVQTRLERYQPERPFDSIISRAFSSLPAFVEGATPLLSEGGSLIAMKGWLPETELAALGEQFTYTIRPVTIPGVDAQRHLLKINHR